MSKQSKITKYFTCLPNNGSDNGINSCDRQSVNKINSKANTNSKERLKSEKSRSFDGSAKAVNRICSVEPKPGRGGRGGPKVCPMYKKIPNTGLAVDAFSYGSIAGISIYFLTHFHSDHYYGLKNSFKHKIYCSPITASLVRHRFPNGLFTLHKVEINESTEVLGTRVTFFEANHCPGAVVILFELKNGFRYLHTGDFRADHKFFSYEPLIRRPIDIIFLDTTYCDPKYDFLPQKQILETIVSISKEYYQKNPKLLIVCGSYSIGKENVFIAIAKALNLKVWTNPSKREIYKCYKNEEMDSILVSNKYISKLHVLPMDSINDSFLQKYLDESNGLYEEVLAFRPTGWEHNKKSLNGVKVRKYNKITILGIEYSEHSSFTELQRFVSFFKPKQIIPTVNNGNQLTRNRMNEFFSQWIKGSVDSSEVMEIPNKPQINGSIISWINKS